MTFVFELRTFRRAISAAYLPPLWKANVTFAEIKQTCILVSAANRLIGEVVQSRRRPLLGPSPG